MNAWVEIHTYELGLLATTTVCMYGGFALHFAPDAPRTIIFDVTPLPTLAASLLSRANEDNPAEGFQLCDAFSVTKAQVEECAPPGQSEMVGAYNWDMVQDACRTMEATLREQNGEDPRLVGALSALYRIKHSPLMRHQPIAISRLPPNRGDVFDQRMRAIFDEVGTLCVSAMSAGLVLHPPSPYRTGGRPSPPVGTLVRRRKKEWEWEPVRDWDWGRAAASTGFLRGKLKTNMHPEELWLRFYHG